MPLYDYDCAACGRRFEVVHGLHAPAPEACPLCGGGPIRKAVTAPAVHFKGSGWAKKERRAAATSGTTASKDGQGKDGDAKDRDAKDGDAKGREGKGDSQTGEAKGGATPSGSTASGGATDSGGATSVSSAAAGGGSPGD